VTTLINAQIPLNFHTLEYRYDVCVTQIYVFMWRILSMQGHVVSKKSEELLRMMNQKDLNGRGPF